MRLTTGLHPHTISLSADGRRLVYGLYDETANVFAVQLKPDRSVSLREARAVTSGSQVIESFAVSPDRRWLVFDSNRNGNQDIWRMPLDGSAPPEPLSDRPGGRVSALLLTRRKAHRLSRRPVSGSQRDLYQVPFAGGKRTRIEVPTANNLAPRISPDGRSVLYTVWGDQGDITVRAMRRPQGDTGWEQSDGRCSRSPPSPRVARTGPPTGAGSPGRREAGFYRADADGRNQRVIAEIGPDLAPFYTRWKGDSKDRLLLGGEERRDLRDRRGAGGRRGRPRGGSLRRADLSELPVRLQRRGRRCCTSCWPTGRATSGRRRSCGSSPQPPGGVRGVTSYT